MVPAEDRRTMLIALAGATVISFVGIIGLDIKEGRSTKHKFTLACIWCRNPTGYRFRRISQRHRLHRQRNCNIDWELPGHHCHIGHLVAVW